MGFALDSIVRRARMSQKKSLYYLFFANHMSSVVLQKSLICKLKILTFSLVVWQNWLFLAVLLEPRLRGDRREKNSKKKINISKQMCKESCWRTTQILQITLFAMWLTTCVYICLWNGKIRFRNTTSLCRWMNCRRAIRGISCDCISLLAALCVDRGFARLFAHIEPQDAKLSLISLGFGKIYAPTYFWPLD